jgi:hypothetical protein
MTNRIIFFVESPFNQRDYGRFGIEILIKNGFKVEIWDFTHILYPGIYSKILPPDPIDYKYQIILNDKITAVNNISKLSGHDIVVVMTPYRGEVYFIYKALSRHGIKYCSFKANIFPIETKSPIKTILMIFNSPIKKTFNAFVSKIPPKLLGVNSATIILAGGSRSTENFNDQKKSKSKILWLHSLDYDLFLQEKDKQTYSSEKYAVFLDEYVPHHPEYSMFGMRSPSSPDDYYPVLNQLFGKLEKKFDLKVIIAAHPRSCYEKYPDYFESRECIRGRTSELIKNAHFVITHCSTANNFTVLFEKPVMFVTTNAINASHMGPLIKLLSSYLGVVLINLCTNYDINQEPRINKQKFDNYRNEYIKIDGTPELPFWQIFSDYIKNMQRW